MNFQDLFQWWNLIYVIPLFVSVVWIAATAIAGADAGDADHGMDADAGADADSDVDHSVDDASTGDADHHSALHGYLYDSHDGHDDIKSCGNGLMTQVLAVLGIGRVPVTLLIGIFMLSWGSFGILSNRFFEGLMKYPAVYIWPSMAVTFVASAVMSRSMAAIMGRIFPKTETFGVSRVQLVGSIGRTVFKITESAGTIDIIDKYGTLHRVQAKVAPGDEAIPASAEVMVLDFDEDDKRFIVRRSTF